MPPSNAEAIEAPDENFACDECGQFGALEIAGRRLCPGCVAQAGCGCAGHGGSES